MIGITIASDNYRSLAWEAARRFKKFTGLNCLIVDTVLPRDEIFKLKLDVWRNTNQTVVLFDSDLWFIDYCNLEKFDKKPDFFAVLDPGVVCDQSAPVIDSKRHKLDLDRYFNSGFLIFNPEHHYLFRQAMDYYNDSSISVRDFGEQTYLNMAVQRTGHPFKQLDAKYNYAPFAEFHKLKQTRLMEPVAIHAMGYSGTCTEDIPDGKEAALKYYMTKYEGGLDLV